MDFAWRRAQERRTVGAELGRAGDFCLRKRSMMLTRKDDVLREREGYASETDCSVVDASLTDNLSLALSCFSINASPTSF